MAHRLPHRSYTAHRGSKNLVLFERLASSRRSAGSCGARFGKTGAVRLRFRTARGRRGDAAQVAARESRAKHHRPAASSPRNSLRDRLTRSCGPWRPISGIGSRATRRTSGQVSERTEARSAIPLLLACHPLEKPQRRKKSSASSSKLKTGRIVPSPSTPPPAPSVRISGGPPPAPTSSLTINQEVSNLVVASVLLSIALSIIRPPSLLRPGHRLSGSRAGRRYLKIHGDVAREHS